MPIYSQKIAIEDIINPDDFAGIETTIVAKNVSAGTDFKSKPPIMVDEFTDKGLVVEAPRGSCRDGHHLLLDFSVRMPNGQIKLAFKATALVVKYENVSDATDRITLDLVQFEQKDWADFMALFQGRQADINDFLQAAKGF